MGRFGTQTKIKNGSYGNVYSVRDEVLGSDVAIKVRMLHDVDEEEGVPQDMLREIKALRELGGLLTSFPSWTSSAHPDAFPSSCSSCSPALCPRSAHCT